MHRFLSLSLHLLLYLLLSHAKGKGYVRPLCDCESQLYYSHRSLLFSFHVSSHLINVASASCSFLSYKIHSSTLIHSIYLPLCPLLSSPLPPSSIHLVIACSLSIYCFPSLSSSVSRLSERRVNFVSFLISTQFTWRNRNDFSWSRMITRLLLTTLTPPVECHEILFLSLFPDSDRLKWFTSCCNFSITAC